MVTSPVSLQQLIHPSTDPAALLDQIRQSPSANIVLIHLRAMVPTLPDSRVEIPQTTYTLYRQFSLTGDRAGYESRYFGKRAMLNRAAVELILGDSGLIDTVQDLLWSICEETSWVLPAHENPRPGVEESPDSRPGASHSALTREPDFIDLFAAETAASLAELLFLIGDWLVPEIVQRARQEIERRIFRPYLTYGRTFWWFKGDLNWNAVCNGAVGLAFMRLERDPQRLAEALAMVLEGFDAYLATGFEADGGSLEGIGYWNYGLLYYVVVADLLREQTAGQLDLLAAPRLRDVARFPLVVALSSGRYLNFGDAKEQAGLQPGITQQLAERTGVEALKHLITFPDHGSAYKVISLPITVRDLVWWDGQPRTFPSAAFQDYHLPACAVVKLTGQMPDGKPVIVAAKAGQNTGHHYHLDIGQFVVHIDGETLLCDPGSGLYTRGYFRDQRFENIFCNSFGHSVPRIAGRQQTAGPKFGNGPLLAGKIVEYRLEGPEKSVTMDFAALYNLPELLALRRKLHLVPETGEFWLDDSFEFAATPLDIEEAFVTWCAVTVEGPVARIEGRQSELTLRIEEPTGASFVNTPLTDECRSNACQETLTRLTVNLPPGACRFVMRILPATR